MFLFFFLGLSFALTSKFCFVFFPFHSRKTNNANRTCLSVLLPLTHHAKGSLSLSSICCHFCFLDSSLFLSNFRSWNFMMLPRVFRFSISDLFGFWWFMFGFWEKKNYKKNWGFRLEMIIFHFNEECILLCLVDWKMSKLKKKMIFLKVFLGCFIFRKPNWAFELLLWN